jgi:type I restriction-modification system DNA methylase subunit
MPKPLKKLEEAIATFERNLSDYKKAGNRYNELSCRNEYIDVLLSTLGWDVRNEKGLSPYYREVIVENSISFEDRPDYTLSLKGIGKLFVEAKKPSIDITRHSDSCFQIRKYGWNAKQKIAILTNFEYLAIYDTTVVPNEGDSPSVARLRLYSYSEYVEKFNELATLLSRDAVYSGAFDTTISSMIDSSGYEKHSVDELFLKQINMWRVSLANHLYVASPKYRELDKLNDIVQEFINRIVFLRICEDRNLPLYHKLSVTIQDPKYLQQQLEDLFKESDRRYNSGLFTGDTLVFDLNNSLIREIVESLYYPKSLYLFNIINANLLGKIYEAFLTEHLVLSDSGHIVLSKKKECLNRSLVSTPVEIVKYMVEQTMGRVCEGKSPGEIMGLSVADIACGSGVFLEEAYQFLVEKCLEWYIANDKRHLVKIAEGNYKLPFDEKKEILSSCIYGIDIDPHAVEATRFSLLVKLVEDETISSLAGAKPILPNLFNNIQQGNALVELGKLTGSKLSGKEKVTIAPFDWIRINKGHPFDVILGNPPYVSTEDMHGLIPKREFEYYKKEYVSPRKQFDKYFLFLEQALRKISTRGYLCYIVPNKFYKIDAGRKLTDLIAKKMSMVRLDDFGELQLFSDQTIYSSILLLQNAQNSEFVYSRVDSPSAVWAGERQTAIRLPATLLYDHPWRLTTDLDLLALLQRLYTVSVSLAQYTNIFNGIQTSAERPIPIYWFSSSEIVSETKTSFTIEREGKHYQIEKQILRPYFKPTKKTEKGLSSYSILSTDKRIIFPYHSNGKLISESELQSFFPGAYQYLKAYYNRLLPKSLSPQGLRDVPDVTEDTWFQYGRTQSLTAFINTPKLIVGVLSKEPMYAFDDSDMLIASGGTAGYCAISRKDDSPYALEYIQAWLSHPITENILRIIGSPFEGGFIARGTSALKALPFIELDFGNKKQKEIYTSVITKTREIIAINKRLATAPSKRICGALKSEKLALIVSIQELIGKVYSLEFKKECK